MFMVGVTGTNGKTSVTQWIAQAMAARGRRCAIVGTLGNGFPGALVPGPNTTPGAAVLRQALPDFERRGATACAMEVSSIGIHQSRVAEVAFDVAVFTNLTRDHLDYHGTMEAYAAEKRRFFDLPGLRAAVLNLDDPFGAALAEELAGRMRVIGYTLEGRTCGGETLSASDIAPDGAGIAFTLAGVRFEAPVIGRFNVSNLLAVTGALLAGGETLENIAGALRGIIPPPGRMETLGGTDRPLVVVDYAHTPDALEKALSTLRETATARGGRLACVFGCGGDRDTGKRPLMGVIAERLADRVIVTSDNPRGEDPAAIIEAVVSGMAVRPETDLDRSRAIVRAILSADVRDVILLAGKGHEPYQEIGGVRHPFSDVGQARAALAVFSAVGSDSRAVTPGMLFIALKGEHFDGHDHVPEALEKGAAGAMVARPWADAHPGLPLMAVDDTRIGLGALAAAWRSRFDIPLIGLTGSNGKTTVKEMCAAILRAHLGEDAVLATAGNLNNDIGLPLTLLKLRLGHRAAVIEMGMNHPGEIAYLTRLARPTVALVNNAQRAHLEGLGGIGDVARAKGEIFEGLADGGIAVINADDPHAGLWRNLATVRPTLTFGIAQPADVSGRWTPHGFGGHLVIASSRDEVEFDLPVPGVHNALNALAATAAALAAGVPLPAAAAALSTYAGVKGRLQRRWGIKGTLVIDDTYNANPDSMRAAIDVLSEVPGRRIFVMGDMGEVGERAGQFHDEVGGHAKSRGVDLLFALGPMSEAAARNFGEGARHFRRVEELVEALKKALEPGTTVLVKGSRFMRMERVVEAIAEGDAHAA
ncbi:MAG: UDP-N-acetylmuramoyl-L-alanyl-D-glutamate--2,6-diaminopimelate ligase [Candidatus Nitricoxidivorans perseverans]|uniref:UDP-N-acetylmuramoyl-tripeptide--D-alanyl-D-alanine ligase n=1 Tax=Candidatus Nitricoxidivorans perseverans TaxID=2975601 RepID=A0AA49FKA7_9PROT|nr:MAG: UDP-N-acetylmuramoyl-L-alanyl-D-glutamate--2,6-diaminopimelate ligase [Candidatus Nitricoxidivorans perseverans]